MTESEYNAALDHIVADPSLTELQKLTRAFDVMTGHFINHYQRDGEVARALGDKDTAVREQIKAGVLNSARGMFQTCYHRVTGTREDIWHG
jgi:hypothetical protein